MGVGVIRLPPIATAAVDVAVDVVATSAGATTNAFTLGAVLLALPLWDAT